MSGLKSLAGPSRRGVTLVELLVVVTLLSILLGIAATAARTGTRGKKQREAARQINAFIAGARTRAIELDRSVGVEIVNNRPNEPQAGLTLFMVETPPAYAGDFTSAVVNVSSVGTNTATLGFKVRLADTHPMPPDNRTIDSLLFLDPDFARPGDVLFLNNRNQPYFVTFVDPTITNQGYRTVSISWGIDQPSPFPWFSGTTIFSPYKLYRQPQRNSVSPLQIPTGVCIDLRFSGTGTTQSELSTVLPTATPTAEDYPKIMFSPNGTIDALYTQDAGSSTVADVKTTRGLPTGNINLLIGRYEKVISVSDWLIAATPTTKSLANLYTLDPPQDGSNLADPEAFWVSINRVTGHVATSNNAVVSGINGSTTDADILASARRFAKQSQSISGR